ncbi:unnamed protein product [Caenorhabditis nigoni]
MSTSITLIFSHMSPSITLIFSHMSPSITLIFTRRSLITSIIQRSNKSSSGLLYVIQRSTFHTHDVCISTSLRHRDPPLSSSSLRAHQTSLLVGSCYDPSASHPDRHCCGPVLWVHNVYSK